MLAAQQIAGALADHGGRVTAVVPHYAMSGGTLIALAADEIVIDATPRSAPSTPARRVRGRVAGRVARLPGDHKDKTLMMADVGRKAIVQVEGSLRGCWRAG